MSASTTIAPAHFPEDADVVRCLFEEYIDSLGIDLSFQDVAAELAGLPGKYASPHGVVLLARDDAGMPLGCVALRPWTQPGTGEIKRLYVRPAARGQALGRRLAEAVIDGARRTGYTRLVLDTLASMRPRAAGLRRAGLPARTRVLRQSVAGHGVPGAGSFARAGVIHGRRIRRPRRESPRAAAPVCRWWGPSTPSPRCRRSSSGWRRQRRRCGG